MKRYVFLPQIVLLSMFYLLCSVTYTTAHESIMDDTQTSTENDISNHQVGKNITHLMYFTGTMCPHCAYVSPTLLCEKVRRHNILVVEYELHTNSINGPFFLKFHKKYKTGLSIPLLVAGVYDGGVLSGDIQILRNIDDLTKKFSGNTLPLLQGNKSFIDLNLQMLPGKPSIWYQDRMMTVKSVFAARNVGGKTNKLLKEFILEGNIPSDAISVSGDKLRVQFPGGSINFKYGFEYSGWLLYTDTLYTDILSNTHN